MLAIVGLLGLVGCAGQDAPATGAPNREPASAVSAPGTGAPPPVREATPPPLPMQRPDHLALRPFDLSSLDGVDDDTVRQHLGDPDTVNENGTGMVWTYRGPGCSLEVYLYPVVGGSAFGVLGYKLFPEDLDERKADRCLKRLHDRSRRS